MSNKVKYFDWLMDIIGAGPDTNYQGRHRLFFFLFKKEYTWVNPMDENRAIDGMGMRDIFYENTGKQSGVTGPCSVLEMLVGLIFRMNEDLYGEINEALATKMIVTMLNSMDIFECNDSHFDDEYVCVQIDNMMSNNIEPSGKGGLFIVNGKEDMRDLDIWYQCLRWLQ